MPDRSLEDVDGGEAWYQHVQQIIWGQKGTPGRGQQYNLANWDGDDYLLRVQHSAASSGKGIDVLSSAGAIRVRTNDSGVTIGGPLVITGGMSVTGGLTADQVAITGVETVRALSIKYKPADAAWSIGATDSATVPGLVFSNAATLRRMQLSDAGFLSQSIGFTDTTSPQFPYHLQRAGADAIFMLQAANSFAGQIYMRTHEGNFGSATASVLNRGLGFIGFQGHNGTTYATGAQIQSLATGNWSGTVNSADIRLSTAASGGTTMTERLRITDNGYIRIYDPASAANYRQLVANGTAFQITQNAGTSAHLTIDSAGVVTIKELTVDTGGADITGDVLLNNALAVVGNVEIDGSLAVGTSGGVITTILKGSTTWNPPSIASGAITSANVTVTGAVVGNPAIASLSTHVDGEVLISAAVTAANTVSVTLHNMGAGAHDYGSGTLTAWVIKS